jgi:hypothetical protein
MDTAERTGPPSRFLARPLPLIALLVVALAVIAAVVLTGHGTRHGSAGASGAAGPGAAGAAAHSAVFHAGDADLLVLDGVSGRVRVTADAGAGGVSGTFARGDGGPVHVSARTDVAAGLRTVTVLCADGAGNATACAGDLTVTVPARTGLRLRQTSGETTLAGLGGKLAVTVASDRLAASGLRPRQADLAITSGSADVGFSTAPDRLGVHATSASVALRVPPAGGYAVTSTAASADVRVQVPREDGSSHAVALHVVSGSLAVLPS